MCTNITSKTFSHFDLHTTYHKIGMKSMTSFFGVKAKKKS